MRPVSSRDLGRRSDWAQDEDEASKYGKSKEETEKSKEEAKIKDTERTELIRELRDFKVIDDLTCWYSREWRSVEWLGVALAVFGAHSDVRRG